MRKLRFVPEGGALVEVTCRTLHGRLLLRPSPELNAIVIGILARASRLYPVRLVAFAFLSNHYHLLLAVEDALALSRFMGYVNSNLAREAGRLADWREKFWSRRYQAILVTPEEGAQVERLQYLLAQGCKEGLVARPQDWPGAHAVRALLGEETLEGLWFDRTQEYLARRRGQAFEYLDYATRESLELAPLPAWRHLAPEAYRERIAGLVADLVAEAAADREGLIGKPPAESAWGPWTCALRIPTTVRPRSRNRQPRSAMRPRAGLGGRSGRLTPGSTRRFARPRRD
jgi:REP element-mobilizing transposase RayT